MTTPDLKYIGKTIARSLVNGKVMYDAVLDRAMEHPFKVAEGSIKYLGPISTSNEQGTLTSVEEAADSLLEDLLKDAIVEDDDDEEEIDLTENYRWTAGEVFIDSRVSGSADGYTNINARLNMNNRRFAYPLEYFLFFLPMDHLYSIIVSINIHARSIGHWVDVTLDEYLMWIALLTVMTVVKHSDRKAYWKQGSSHFFMNVDFTKYMSFTRFNGIMKMHTFEIPSKQAQTADPLYQIRSTITAFNDHMEKCITPGKYLVIDESMNQWLGTGMPNIKKVPRKPHSIGQEFKTLADNHTYCIIRIDTVSDPCQKEFDNEPGMKKLTATVKRLVKPWFSTGRTVIADSWFGSPAMISMLLNNGLYSIMQVTKRAYWPRGMSNTDMVQSVDQAYGSHFKMMKNTNCGRVFTCAYRDQKVKAFISSCSTTKLTGERSFKVDGNIITIKRPEVVQEYETHKSR